MQVSVAPYQGNAVGINTSVSAPGTVPGTSGSLRYLLNKWSFWISFESIFMFLHSLKHTHDNWNIFHFFEGRGVFWEGGCWESCSCCPPFPTTSKLSWVAQMVGWHLGRTWKKWSRHQFSENKKACEGLCSCLGQRMKWGREYWRENKYSEVPRESLNKTWCFGSREGGNI